MTDINVLPIIAGAIERAGDELPVQVSITLWVHGATIEGELIGARQFYAEQAERLSSTNDPFAATLATLFQNTFEHEEEEFTENLERMRPEVRGTGQPPSLATYLHLATNVNGRRELRQVRIAAVDAWSLGSASMAS